MKNINKILTITASVLGIAVIGSSVMAAPSNNPADNNLPDAKFNSVEATTNGDFAIEGNSKNNYGVVGISENESGVYGSSNGSASRSGVIGQTKNGNGVLGVSTDGVGIYGIINNTNTNIFAKAGEFNNTKYNTIVSLGTKDNAIQAISNSILDPYSTIKSIQNGTLGLAGEFVNTVSNNSIKLGGNDFAVNAEGKGGSTGVKGSSESFIGVQGTSKSGIAVSGVINAADGTISSKAGSFINYKSGKSAILGTNDYAIEIGGDIKMSSSDKGVVLNNADRPLITRSWDVFTSGTLTGVGRWGLFMQPSFITTGFANLTGKGFKITAFNSDSTTKDLLTVKNNNSPTASTDRGEIIANANVTVNGDSMFNGSRFSINTTKDNDPGIVMNGYLGPLITKMYSSFSSGEYSGLGRYGLFVEPSTMILGFPNLVGRMAKIVAYNADSTYQDVATFGINKVQIHTPNLEVTGHIKASNGMGQLKVVSLAANSIAPGTERQIQLICPPNNIIYSCSMAQTPDPKILTSANMAQTAVYYGHNATTKEVTDHCSVFVKNNAPTTGFATALALCFDSNG